MRQRGSPAREDGGEDVKRILLRHAENDYGALLVAAGMTAAGAEVFSITNNGPARPQAFAMPVEDHIRPQKFIAWARVRDDAHIAECDEAIDKCREEQKP